jgi:hypothetical protein
MIDFKNLQTRRAERDWPEDSSHENGNYLCHCSACQHDFTGHKRRTLCRVCHREAVMDSRAKCVCKNAGSETKPCEAPHCFCVIVPPSTAGHKR